MILTRDTNHGDYEIRSYEPGQLKINDQIFTQSVLVGSDRLALWDAKDINTLTEEQLAGIFTFKPDLVLLGTGEKLIFPENKLLQPFYHQQIGVEIMTTLAACHTFNVLMSEGRNVVAALLIK